MLLCFEVNSGPLYRVCYMIYYNYAENKGYEKYSTGHVLPIVYVLLFILGFMCEG